ncbi:MAG: 3'-5' exonuclease [Rhizomicrobium sp.]
MTDSPPLQIQLVPALAWGRNVRAVVAGDTWEALRWHLGAALFRPRFLSLDLPEHTYRERLKCAYCGAEQRSLDLHELWHFDDDNRVQRLIGLEPICSKCHLSVHMGYANATGRTQEAKTHLASVNGWTAAQAKTHSDQTFALWESRAATRYELDVSYLARFNIPPGKIHMDWLEKPRSWVGSRLDAIMWAARMLDSDAIIVDTETTGLLDKSNVEVIELAAINMRGKLIYQGTFKPRYKIPKRVIEIHGITNEAVKECPSFAQEAEAMRAFLHGQTVVTYNARFDRDVIGRTFGLHKLEGVSARWECAMQTYRTFARSGPYLKLPYGSHRALADCRATLRLIRKMARAEA